MEDAVGGQRENRRRRSGIRFSGGGTRDEDRFWGHYYKNRKLRGLCPRQVLVKPLLMGFARTL